MQKYAPIADGPILVRFFLLPTFAFVILFLVLTYSGLDHALTDVLFRIQGQAWRLRDNAILEYGFHQLGKYLSIVAWLACIYGLIRNRREGFATPRQKALLLLIMAVIITTTVASTAKGLTHMDCPWDLTIYGGTKVYVPLLERDLINATPGRCFPAGQASAGYAWIALYFAALLYRPAWRWKGLLMGLAFGVALGFAQQLRGAHFLSHDLTTAWIAWTVAAAIFAILRNQSPPTAV